MRWMGLIFLLFTVGQVGAEPQHCLKPPYTAASTSEQEKLAELFLSVSPAFSKIPSLNPQRRKDAPELCLSDNLNGALGHFDTEKARVALLRGLPSDLQSAILLHELRHFEQYKRGFCPSNKVSMHENARAVFAMEADASAVSLLAAWTLKENGQLGIWTALAGWNNQKDIAERFEATMQRTGDANDALVDAFDQWYASEERRLDYYTASCADYLDRQDALHLLPSYKLLPAGFFKDLCQLSEEIGYSCREPDREDH